MKLPTNLSINPVRDYAIEAPNVSNTSLDNVLKSEHTSMASSAVAIDQNYDSFYLNPSLESLLNKRGFSTQRAEILGMFNYDPPLAKSESGSSSTDSSLIITSFGELYDYQCQLKQMRYSDALSFFDQVVGFNIRESSDGTRSLYVPAFQNTNGESIDTLSSLEENYENQMEIADKVLNYLAEIYNAISGFIDAQNISDAYSTYMTLLDIAEVAFKVPENITLRNPVTNSWNNIAGILPAGDINVSALPFLDNEQRLTVGQFLRGVLKIQDDSDTYSALLRGSGTCDMLNLLHIMAAGALGIEAYVGLKENDTDFETINTSYTTGKLIGTNAYTPDSYPDILTNSITGDIVEWKDGVDFDVGSFFGAGVGDATADATADPFQDLILKNATGETLDIETISIKQSMNHNGTATDNGYLSDLIHYVGLDEMQVSVLKGSSNIGGVSTSSVSSIEDLVEKTMGRNISESYDSILDNLPESEDCITRHVITKNRDTTTSDSRDAVESLTSTNYQLAGTLSDVRSGRSYYCDEIPTIEFDESIERLRDFRNSSASLLSSVKDYAKLSTFKYRESYLKDSNFQWGYLGKESTLEIVPSTFFHYILKSMRDSIDTYIQEDQAHVGYGNPTHDYNNSLTFVAAALSTYDEAIAYRVAALNLSYADFVDGKISQSQWNSRAKSFEISVIKRLIEGHSSAWNGGGASGYGHLITYGKCAVSDEKVKHNVIYDHVVGNAKLNSDYIFRPWDSAGLYIDSNASMASILDTFWSMGASHDKIEDIWNVLGGACKNFGWDSKYTSDAPRNILLSPYHAMRKFREDTRLANGADAPSPGDSGASNSLRSISDTNKIVASFLVQKKLWKIGLKCGLYIQNEGLFDMTNYSSDTSGRGRILYCLNKRGMTSFVNAVDLFQNNQPLGMTLNGKFFATNDDSAYFDPDTLLNRKGDSIIDDDHYGKFTAASPYDGYGSPYWSMGYGPQIAEMIGVFKNMLTPSICRERTCQLSMLLIGRIIDQIDGASINLLSAIVSSDTQEQEYNNALSLVKSDPDFQSSALLGITRDQLTLNRAIKDSFSSPNREYPYLPASKAILTNQSKNLTGFLSLDEMLGSNTAGRKFIAPIGIPAGLVESLRNRMMDETGSTKYRTQGNLVEISIWKRDLLHERTLYSPKKYVFDMTKFIITGRSDPTAEGANLLDAAADPPNSQDFNTVMRNVVSRKYSPDGNISTTIGKLAYNNWDSNETSLTSEEVFKNHIVDNYLKTFMKLTSGFDVSEDVFPFLEGNVFFEGSDPDQQDLLESLSKTAEELFVDRDAETALNYKRLIGEITRSVYLSPEKYRNRIIYPKIFDRVFCIMIDPDDFEISDSMFDGGPADRGPDLGFLEFSGNTDEYTQYYCTISILPPLTWEDYTFRDSGTGEVESSAPVEMREVEIDVSDAVLGADNIKDKFL